MGFSFQRHFKTVSFHTLGCKLNFAETSTISRLFAESGYLKVDFGQKADVVVINTCTVTGQADKKCRQAISKAVKTSPDSIIVVVGCYAELEANKIALLPGVNLVLGNHEKFDIIERINALNDTKKNIAAGCNDHTAQNFFPSYSLLDRTRSFLKVQDGCDYRCTYCAIPMARGHSRNAPITEIVEQANIIAAKGVREIVLTGVNIGDFGRSTDENFLQLLTALDAVNGIDRIRIGSVEPNLITEEIVQFISRSQRLAAHFHVPLQSGCDKILKLMGRRYLRNLFAQKVELIHRCMPHASVGADVIVGFPSETDEDFFDTYNFIEQLDVSYLHVFPYSERPNTKAILIPDKVSSQKAEERSHLLIELSNKKRQQFYDRHVGKVMKTLFEQKEKNGLMTGFTDNYIRVETVYDPEMIGCCVDVKLESRGTSSNMRGTIIDV